MNNPQKRTRPSLLAAAGVLACCASCGPETANPDMANKGASQSPALADVGSVAVGHSPIDETATIATSASRAFLDAMADDLDPRRDGWDTEVFAEHASLSLKHVGQFIVSVASAQAAAQADFLAEGFSCTALRPESLDTTFDDGTITAHGASNADHDRIYRGVDGFAQAVEKLVASRADASDLRFKFKLFRVEPTDNSIQTTVYFELSGVTASGAFQQNATWNCRWSQPSQGEPPRLLSIDVGDYEEVEIRHAEQKLFTDCTESLFQGLPAYEQQLRHGIDYWRARLESYLRIYWDGQHGVAIADVNGDGLDDVYFCEPGGLPNRLFLQQPTGRLADVSTQSGIDFLDYVHSVLFLDLDNDGDQDVVLPTYGKVRVFSNNGQGEFRLRATMTVDEETAYSIAATDYDEDGDLDFYVCYYRGTGGDESNRLPAPYPFHDARTGGRNHLFRNQGFRNQDDWRFQDVTKQVGLDHHNDRWSYAAVWEDFDNDGDQDIYVANDFGRNNFYRNDQGHFQDVAASARAEDRNFGMSATAGDYDRDGWMDLYVSNMFSAAGGRITFQQKFKSEESQEIKTAYQQMARGNTLLRNRGDGTFDDVSDNTGTTMGRWAWASLFSDVNNDGWEDLLVANGYVTGKMPDDL